MFDLSGRVAVVTGGNGGIGLGMARALAEAGADLAIWARDVDRSAAAIAELAGGDTYLPGERRIIACACDVSDEAQVDAAMARTLDELGQVDALIANAGVGGYAPFVDMSLDEWRRVQAVNLDGAFLSLRAGARHMVERGAGGALVATSSVSAIHGAPRMQHYAAAKAGVIAMIRGLAVELARHGIRANAILPGWTASGMLDPDQASPKFVDATIGRTPARRWGVPSDLGPAAVFLADPTLAFHTGDTIVVDGGYSIF